MNPELARLEEQLQKSFEGEAWHGPSVLEALDGITSSQASHHPIAGGHSIWELALHLAGTYRLVLRRLQGDSTPLSAEEDWPPVGPVTEENWRASIDALRALNADVRRAVARFDPAKLDDPIVPQPAYSAHTQFIGITQHDLYHAGQIVLLRRAVGARSAPEPTTPNQPRDAGY